jgi:hypothetical protein
MALLGSLCMLGAFIVGILVAVQAFKRSKIVPGIFLIICWPFTLIYGWMKADEWSVKNLMIAYTILLVLGLVLQYMSGGLSFTYTRT